MNLIYPSDFSVYLYSKYLFFLNTNSIKNDDKAITVDPQTMQGLWVDQTHAAFQLKCRFPILQTVEIYV